MLGEELLEGEDGKMSLTTRMEGHLGRRQETLHWIRETTETILFGTLLLASMIPTHVTPL
jgi:hypothetical protein